MKYLFGIVFPTLCVIIFLGWFPHAQDALEVIISNKMLCFLLSFSGLLLGVWSLVLVYFGNEIFLKLNGIMMLKRSFGKHFNISCRNYIRIMRDIDSTDMWSFGFQVLGNIYHDKKYAEVIKKDFDISKKVFVISTSNRQFKLIEKLEEKGYVSIFQNEEVSEKYKKEYGNEYNFMCFIFTEKTNDILGLDHDLDIMKVRNRVCLIMNPSSIIKIDFNMNSEIPIQETLPRIGRP